MRLVVVVIALCLSCVSHAQRNDDSWQQYLTELYGGDEEAAVSMEEAYEHLTELAQQPLDINKVETQDLMEIPGLDQEQINDILTYRHRYGNFRSIDELAMVRSIDNRQRLFLSHFLAVYTNEKAKWYSRQGLKELFGSRGSNGTSGTIRNEVTLTAQIPTYYRAGDINAPTKTYLGTNRYAGKYLGDPVKHSLRYSLDIGKYISFNLTGTKTAGEPFFGSDAAAEPVNRNKYGYDAYAFNLTVKQLGVFRQIILGQFRGQFGMGLILNNNFYMGKTGMLASMGRRMSGFTPHSSGSDSKHFQGIAATVDITKRLQLSAFFSYRYIDATLNADSTIATIITTGYHRTTTEMAKKNNSAQLTTGMHIGYERHSWGVGVSGIFSHIDRDINPVYSKTGTVTSGRKYRLYNPTGNDFWNISMDYRYRWRDLSFAGETATGGALTGLSGVSEKTQNGKSKGSVATVNSLTWKSPWNITFMALQRYYSYQYTSLYGRSFGENSTPQNESGFYFGVQWMPRRDLTIDAYTDIAYFPWLKYLVSASSYSWDNSVMATLTKDKWTWSLRYRIKTKQKDKTINEHKYLMNRTDQRLRLLAQLNTTHWTSRTQLEGCLLNFDSSSKGFIVSEGLGYRWYSESKGYSKSIGYSESSKYSFFSVSGSAAYFNTEDYDSRLYTWEPGMKYSFGSAAYYGHGMRLSLIASYQPWRWLIASAKVSHTRYFDRSEIGTAERMIFSDHCTNIDCQLIFKL